MSCANNHHSRAIFFQLKREEGVFAADIWKRILAIERNCDFGKTTAAELLAPKFLSVIVKYTGDYDLQRKIRKNDMSVEAITEALQEYMYKKLQDSPETEDEKKIRYLNKSKARSTKEATNKPTKFKRWTVTDAEHRTGPDNMNARQEERNVPTSIKLAITRNVAEQTKE